MGDPGADTYLRAMAILTVGMAFFSDNFTATVIVPLLPSLHDVETELRGGESCSACVVLAQLRG